MLDLIPYSKLEMLSRADAEIPLYQKIIKVGEEKGELDQAFLAYDNANNASASAKTPEPLLDVLEECCDVIIATMDVVNFLTEDNVSLSIQTKELFANKMRKWENKQKAAQK